ncbi:amino acid permease, partial [Aspergillus ochraceoroseus]
MAPRTHNEQLTEQEPFGGEETRSQTESQDDAALLKTMGYKPVLHRTYTFFENFSTTFAALYFIGGVRVTFSTGIAAGGNLAYWTSYLVTMVFTYITAAVIAEVCSASPSAGSIYLWAAEAGGPRFGRLLGFIVAWWSTTAWTTFCASNTQAAVNYMLSELTVFNVDFPQDTYSVKFRAVQWICTEVLLALAALVNFLPPKLFRSIFYLSSMIVVLDFLLNIIWLPIGAHNTWGFRTAEEAFMSTYNGTGAPPAWNWCLSYLATAGILIGFDASGHVAEETKNASVTAARGIFWSTVVSGIGGLFSIILFLFCAPTPDVLFSFGSPQPFVPLYAAVLGKGGHIFMNIICIFALWLVEHRNRHNRCLAPRFRRCPRWSAPLLYLGLPRARRPTPQRRNRRLGRRSRNHLHPTPLRRGIHIARLGRRCPQRRTYGLICLARLICTPNRFPKPAWSLGKWSKPFQFIAVFWNAWVVAILFSPYEFPVNGQNLNYAPIIMAAVTIFAVASYFLMPEEAWLPRDRISQFIDSKGVVAETVEEVGGGPAEATAGASSAVQ